MQYVLHPVWPIRYRSTNVQSKGLVYEKNFTIIAQLLQLISITKIKCHFHPFFPDKSRLRQDQLI